METIILRVEGMMCQKNCGSTVQSALSNVPGVKSAKASFATRSATVEGTSLSREALIRAIDDVGFAAEVLEQTPPDIILRVTGMMCQKNCASTVSLLSPYFLFSFVPSSVCFVLIHTK